MANQSLNVSSGASLDGYTGSITVAAGGGNNTDSVMLNGTAANVLTVSATPNTLTTDQNTSKTFQANVNTSLADTYNLTAQAPPGWTVTMSSTGLVTVTPAPGLQSGTYPIEIVAQSTTDANLVAQIVVNVTIKPTTPGLNLGVAPDPLFTVPYNGAQLPTAFQASLQNLGPAADTYNLTFANIPSGFTLVNSGTSVTVPAGQTGILGLYLQPDTNQSIPPPGTQLSFTVTATSTSNPSITQTQTVTFTIPAIDAVTLNGNLPQVSSAPGTPTTATLTLQDVGNVPETVSLSGTTATGLTVSGLNSITLAPGQTATEPVTLTPDASVTLNSTLAATITATYGPTANPQTTTTEIGLLVRSPQTVAISQAADAAGQANETQLATTLSELGDAVSQLQAAPTNAALLSRVQFQLGNLITLANGNPALTSFLPQLNNIQATANSGDTAGMLSLLPSVFQNMTTTFQIEATQQFTVSLSPGEVDLQPGQNHDFTVTLTNTGSDPIDGVQLSLGALPSAVTGTFDQNIFSLAPGASATADLTLSNALVSSKIFTLDVTGAASVAQHTATAVVAVRPATADVTGVTLGATTIQAGTPVSVSAQVFNTANVARNVLAHVDVIDDTNSVVSSLPDVPVTLTPGTDSQTLNLGSVNTTGLANGAYAVRVSLRATDGVPLPGNSSLAPFVVGLPFTASVSASATNLPPGTSTVTTTITVSDPAVGPAGPPSGGDPGPTGGSPPPSGPVPDDALVWVGGASGNWDVVANWLDTTTNTHHLPTASDAVTINTPGTTVTVSDSETALSVTVAAGSTLALNRATLALGPNNSEIDGNLTVDSSTLQLGGALTLVGTTQILNTTGVVFLDLNGNTLTNLGTLTLGAAGSSTNVRLLAQTASQGGTLLNEGAITQQGTGALTLADGIELDNTTPGSYVFAGDGSITHGGGNTPSLVNAGTLRKSGGTGTSSLSSVAISNTGGTLQVDSGTLNLDPAGDSGTSTGGTFLVAAQATLDLTASYGNVFTGTYTGSGGGTVLVAGHTLYIGSGGATFNFPAGMFQWGDGGTIDLQGNTLTNAGTMTIGSATTNTTELLHSTDSTGNTAAHGTLLNTGTIVQQGGGALNLYDTVAVDNQGSYQIPANGSLANNSGALVAAFDNAGTLAVTGTGTTAVSATLNNSGTTQVSAGTLALNAYVNNTGTVLADGATVTVTSRGGIYGNQLEGGQWVARDGGTIAFPTALTFSQASLTVDGAGSALTGLQNLAVNTGTIAVTNGASLVTSTNLDNQGTITLGPAGTLTVGGTFTQEAAGTLDVQLGGAPATGQFGKLAVGKGMTLGGVLRAELAGGYTPAAGDSFPAVTSAGSSGQFAAVDLPASAAVAFAAAVNPNGIVLTAQAATATPTTTTVTSSLPAGTTFGQSITFTASVQAAGGTATPTGAVQFQIDGANVGSPVPLTGGSAGLTTTLAVGAHTVAAVFVSNSPQFAASDDAANPLSQTVSPGTPSPAANVTLYYTIGGSNPGTVNQVAVGYDGTNLTFGASGTPISTPSGDGLIFLPNGNLLVGGNTIAQVDPSSGLVVGTINTVGDHMALDPGGTRVWTSAEAGALEEVPLTPFGTVVTHSVHGDDNGVTQLAFTPDGRVFYTDSNNFGTGDFGEIDLSTFTTQRLLSGVPAAHGLIYDPFTGDLIMVGAGNVTQFDPRTMRVVSTRQVGGRLDQGEVDGAGHLYVGDNNGNLVFLDYSATGLVGDPRDFVGQPFVASGLDDIAPVAGLGAPGTPITVNHLLPASGYAVDPTSVSPAGAVSPSAVVWHGQIPAGSTAPLTFQLTGQVTNLAPGEARQISQGTTVTVVVGAPGGSVLPVSIQLPAVVVSANHIIGLTPVAESADRNSRVSYTVALSNPLPTAATYTLSVAGLDGMTVSLPASVTVPAGQTVDVPLTVTVPAGAIPGTQAFEVQAQTAQGGQDSVEGQLSIASAIDLPSTAVSLTLTPSQAVVGQGTSTVYTVQVTNTGNSDDSFTLATSGLPAGVTATFSQTKVEVPPGVSNFRDVTLTLTAAPGTAAGSDPFTVTATSAGDPAVAATAGGTLTVLSTGVSVAFDQPSVVPGGTWQLTVTNTGQVSDTFDLSLGGPAALVASLGLSKVTLAPGASQAVPVTTSPVNFAVPGALALIGTAQSETDPAVQDSASAALTIPDTSGLTAQLSPSVQVVPVPGTSSFLLMVNNTGNTEDAYTATITGTSGPITASLMGLDGTPTQTIPEFRLPGLSQGAILLQATGTGFGTGDVNVQVTSQSDAGRSVVSTAQLNVVGGPINGTGVPVNGFEFTALNQVTVATFTQGAGNQAPGNFHVIINWGDGSPPDTTTGQVTEANGAYTVTGSHTYTDESYQEPGHVYAVTAQVSDGTNSAAIPTAATVLEELLPDGTRGTADQRFISELYRDLLGRAVDPAGLASWTAYLQTHSRIDTVTAIMNDPGHEYRTVQVEGLYRQYLGRAADPGGLQAGVSFLVGGGTVEQLAAILVSSPEFFQFQAGGTTDGFVRALYRDALGRSVDAASEAALMQLLGGTGGNPGVMRAAIAAGLFSDGGGEYARFLVRGYYEQFLDREPDPAQAAWEGLLGAGSRDEAVIAFMLGDPNLQEFYGKTAP